MNKREFLAVGGAVPLVLAGCGGSGSGSAPVRLVNASVSSDYASLGFMDESTQAVTGVAYGTASSYVNVQAGSVDITLTLGSSSTSAAAAQTRSINKDTRYTLVAYGYTNELKSVLITESTTTPDSGKANVNVLNTSSDIGAVDVYLSTDASSRYVNQIASSLSGVSQSAFSAMTVATTTGGTQYYITVVGAGSVAKGISDVRFQSSGSYEFDNQKVYTILLTPGASGVLANIIVMEQGSGGTVTSTLNTTARVRAVTSLGGLTAKVDGTNGTTAVSILPSSSTSQYSNYYVVNTGTAPTVTVAGNAIPVTTDGTTVATLAAGGDYTLMVYLVNGSPVAKVVEDNNTAPVSSSGAKFRLINLANNNQGLQLSMSVNSVSIASTITYGNASSYTEYTPPQTTASVVEISDGDSVVKSRSQVLTLGNIFTEIVTGVDPSTGAVTDFFRSASGT